VPARALANEANTSLSAEAMSILVDYHQRFRPNDNDRFTADSKKLVNVLRAAEAAAGGRARAVLHDHLREALDQGSPELLWLRDRFGVVFSGVEYGRIGALRPDEWPTPSRVDDICHVDPTRRESLLLEVLHDLSASGAPTRARQRGEDGRERKRTPRTEERARRGLPPSP
jgi:hypothetical protein